MKREKVSGRGKQSQVEKGNGRWRGVIAGGAITGGAKQSQAEGSDRRWRGAIASEAGGGERPQVEGSGHRWRGGIAGGGERFIVGRDIR